MADDVVTFERDGGFYAQVKSDSDNELVVAFDKDGALYISVSDEKAVDSYNQLFTCSIDLPPAAAAALVKFLTLA